MQPGGSYFRRKMNPLFFYSLQVVDPKDALVNCPLAELVAIDEIYFEDINCLNLHMVGTVIARKPCRENGRVRRAITMAPIGTGQFPLAITFLGTG